MLHVVFQLQMVVPKIHVARKVHVKKSCNKEFKLPCEPAPKVPLRPQLESVSCPLDACEPFDFDFPEENQPVL